MTGGTDVIHTHTDYCVAVLVFRVNGSYILCSHLRTTRCVRRVLCNIQRVYNTKVTSHLLTRSYSFVLKQANPLFYDTLTAALANR